VRNGRPPHSHYRVSDELLDVTAEPLDDISGAIEVGGQGRSDDLGISRLRELGETDKVGEEHDNKPAFVGIPIEGGSLIGGVFDPGSLECPPALTAEPIGGVVERPAPRTYRTEWMATVAAESAGRFVFAPAVGAHHRASQSSASSTRLPSERNCSEGPIQSHERHFPAAGHGLFLGGPRPPT